VVVGGICSACCAASCCYADREGKSCCRSSCRAGKLLLLPVWPVWPVVGVVAPADEGRAFEVGTWGLFERSGVRAGNCARIKKAIASRASAGNGLWWWCGIVRGLQFSHFGAQCGECGRIVKSRQNQRPEPFSVALGLFLASGIVRGQLDKRGVIVGAFRLVEF